MKNFFLEKQKRDSFLLSSCRAKVTLSNYLGPHKEKPGGLVFTAAVSGMTKQIQTLLFFRSAVK